jgi:hypothetical protein
LGDPQQRVGLLFGVADTEARGEIRKHFGIRARFADLGLDIVPRDQQTPEALAAHHKAETEKWWPIIRASNLKAE